MVKYRRNYEETRNEPYHRYGRNSYRHYDRPHNTSTATHNTQNASMQRHYARTASYNNANDADNGHEYYKSKHATTISPSHRTHNNATSHRHAKEEEWREHTCANASARQDERYPENHERHSYLSESHHKHHSHTFRESSPLPFTWKNPVSHVNEYKERSKQSEQEWGKAHKRKRSLLSSREYSEEYNNRNPKYLRSETRELAQNELLPPPPAYNEHMQYSNNHNNHYTKTNIYNDVNRTGYDRNDAYTNINRGHDYERRRSSNDEHDNTYHRHSSSWTAHRSKDNHHKYRRYSPYSTRSEENKYGRELSYDEHRQELDDSHNKSDGKELGYSHNRRFGYGEMYMSRSVTPSITSSHDSRTSFSASRDLWNKSSKSHEYYDDQNSWDHYQSANTYNYHSNNNNNNNISKKNNEHRYSDKTSCEKNYNNARRHYRESRHTTSKQHSPTHQSKSLYDNKTKYAKKNEEKQQSTAWPKATNVLPALSPISPISEESTSLAPTPIHSSAHECTQTDMKTKEADTREDEKLEIISVEEEQEQERHSQKLTDKYCEEGKKYSDNITNKVCTTSANANVNDSSCNNNISVENITSSVSNEEKNQNMDNKAPVQVRKRREEIEKEYLNWLYATTSIDSTTKETHTVHSERTLHDKEPNVVKKENVEEEEEEEKEVEKQKELHLTQTTPLPRLHSVALTDWRSIKPTEPFYAETDLTALRLAPQLSSFSSLNFTLTTKNEQEQVQTEKRNGEANDKLHLIKNDEEVQNKTVNNSDDKNVNISTVEEKNKIIYADSYHTEAIACFNHHFNYGKVHPKPPWYLCANLHDNCEHPYYVDWLDTIQLPSLSEQLTQARIKRTILASANKHKKDEEENSERSNNDENSK